jgi:hypothetical protein
LCFGSRFRATSPVKGHGKSPATGSVHRLTSIYLDRIDL